MSNCMDRIFSDPPTSMNRPNCNGRLYACSMMNRSGAFVIVTVPGGPSCGAVAGRPGGRGAPRLKVQRLSPLGFCLTDATSNTDGFCAGSVIPTPTRMTVVNHATRVIVHPHREVGPLQSAEGGLPHLPYAR